MKIHLMTYLVVSSQKWNINLKLRVSSVGDFYLPTNFSQTAETVLDGMAGTKPQREYLL